MVSNKAEYILTYMEELSINYMHNYMQVELIYAYERIKKANPHTTKNMIHSPTRF